MSENPWKRRHPGRSLPGQAGKASKTVIRGRTSDASSKPVRASLRLSDPEQIRKKLFAAGWKPSMAGLPITDDKIRDLLLDLNAALRLKTQRRIREHARSG